MSPTGRKLEPLDRWFGLLGLVALGGEAVAFAKGVRGAQIAARAARTERAATRGARVGEALLNCLPHSFAANTKVWVSKAANDLTKSSKALLEKSKSITNKVTKTVLTAVAISSVGVGTQVLAHNEQTKAETPQTVIATHEHIDPILVTLELETSEGKRETITTTPEHPFFALFEPDKNANGTWVNAGELEKGNWLKRADSDYGVVKRVTFEAKAQRMYNLTVATDHTFFVGEGRWLVHNANSKKCKDAIKAVEAASGHALRRHGAGVTDNQLRYRARTGYTPDGQQLRRVTASAFNSWQDMDEAIGRAQALCKAGTWSNSIPPLEMGRVVGRGFVTGREPSAIALTAVKVVLDESCAVITAFPGK